MSNSILSAVFEKFLQNYNLFLNYANIFAEKMQIFVKFLQNWYLNLILWAF